MGCVLQNCSRIPSSSQDSQYRPCFDWSWTSTSHMLL
jgi:hypothetical protein